MRSNQITKNHLKEVPVYSVGDTENALQFLDELATRTDAPVASYDSTYGRVLFVNHPDSVKSVIGSTNYVRTTLLSRALGTGLITSDGAYWHNQRRLAQPVFHGHCMPGFATVVTDAMVAMLRDWEATKLCEAPFDLAVQMRYVTMQVIVKAMFSIDLDLKTAEQWDVVFQAVISDASPFALPLFNQPTTVSPARNKVFKEALGVVDEIIYTMIADRRTLKDQPRDLLTLLVNGDDKKQEAPLTDLQIRDEVITMLFAGHETTAIAISWTLHLLGSHPDVMRRVVSEIDAELQGEVPSYQDLPRLPELKNVFEESMRLYPPVWALTRQAIEEDEIAGYRIPAKSIVLVSPYMTHKHPDFWDEPERFDPDRFSKERSEGRHRSAYIPFLAARHQCLGKPFALMEGQLILALLLQHYSIEPVAGFRVEPDPSASLRQKNGMMVTATRRRVTKTSV
jgi:cytochrome P450